MLSWGAMVFFFFACYLMVVRENGTHEQRVFWFGEEGAIKEELMNIKRREKRD